MRCCDKEAKYQVTPEHVLEYVYSRRATMTVIEFQDQVIASVSVLDGLINAHEIGIFGAVESCLKQEATLIAQGKITGGTSVGDRILADHRDMPKLEVVS
jgi:hypothetical protein